MLELTGEYNRQEEDLLSQIKYTQRDFPMDATFTIPKTFLSVIKVREDELDRFLRRTLAVAFYRDGRLSLGKAAEFAGMKSKWEMIMLLDENNVPVDYSADDAESYIKTLKRHLA